MDMAACIGCGACAAACPNGSASLEPRSVTSACCRRGNPRGTDASPATPELSHKRHDLAPAIDEAFGAFSKQVFADGALPARMKQIIAVAVAHVTQCPYCIRGHTNAALRAGARPEELMEAIWVAAEMRAGGAFAHATVSLSAMAEASQNK